MKKGIIATLSSISGAILGVVVAGKATAEEIRKQKGYAQKHLALYLMMNQWVKVKQEDKSIVDYLKKEGYKRVAIYGMNYVGETLLKELSNSDIRVEYGIDKNANSIYADINVVLPDEDLRDVDVVIVTAVTFFDEIEEALMRKMNCPILSLETILYEI
ncbi:MAG: hypothetical protein NC489_14295 [Ruminococcus flavefaciens]|nr:hypothetical protein [Ruminococcus flavefaciens]